MTNEQAKFLAERKRVIQSAVLVVPANIKLAPEGSHITWGLETKTWVKPGRDKNLLNDFIQLSKSDARGSAVIAFAKKWGVLYLDQQGRPCQKGIAAQSEPLEAWAYFARRARAVLGIATALKEGKLPDIEYWSVLRNSAVDTGDFLDELKRYRPIDAIYAGGQYPFASDLSEPCKRKLEIEQFHLMQELNWWLQLGRVGFIVSPVEKQFKDARWELQVSYNGCVLSAVALQLAMAIVEVDSLFTCSGCGVPYARQTKSPRGDQRNFCPRCGNDVPGKQASQRRNKRMAEARRLDREGYSLAKIAKLLDINVVAVEKLLRRANGKARAR